jgi:hypothetical protein
VKSDRGNDFESTYYHVKKEFKVKDGLSEKSIILLLQRLIVTNFARLRFVSREGWKEMGSVALDYLRERHPILAGGYAGKLLGSFHEILKVY